MPESIKKMKEDNNIAKLLLSLSIPTIISGLVDTLYNTIDSIFVGNYVGTEGLAALSIINVIQLMYISIGVLFSVGNASIISRALGAMHYKRVIQSLIHSFWGLFFISNIISFSILFNLDSFLKLIGAPEHILSYARDYGKIILWTGFILPINNLLLGSFRAKGQAIKATYLNVLGAVLNIGLDALFIIVFGWGVAGAALATAISQAIVFVFAIQGIKKLYSTNLLLHNKKEYNLSILKEILVVGTPTGLRLMLFVVVFSVANIVLAPYGAEYLSAFGVHNRIISIMSMINISLSIGAQPLIGINYGAQLYERVKRIIMITLSLGMIISILTTIFLFVAPKEVYSLFTKDQNIIIICQKIARVQAYAYGFWGIFICITETLQAMGHAKESFWLSISYPLIVTAGFIGFNYLWGVEGTFWAIPIACLFVGIFSILILQKDLKQLQFKLDNLKKAY